MKIKTAALALLAMLLLGCGGEGENNTPAPSAEPSVDPAAMINIDGTLRIYQSGEYYRIECKSNIPNGAYVTMFIEDENESVLSEISDLKQRLSSDDVDDVKKSEGKVTAEVPVANLQKSIELNGSTQLFVRMQFFPGGEAQDSSVKDICGSKGQLLTGNNVQKDDLAGQMYIEMLSEGISIGSTIAPTDNTEQTSEPQGTE